MSKGPNGQKRPASRNNLFRQAAMSKGPKGQKRPADVVSNAVKVMKIATGEEKEEFDGSDGKDPAAQAILTHSFVVPCSVNSDSSVSFIFPSYWS